MHIGLGKDRRQRPRPPWRTLLPDIYNLHCMLAYNQKETFKSLMVSLETFFYEVRSSGDYSYGSPPPPKSRSSKVH